MLAPRIPRRQRFFAACLVLAAMAVASTPSVGTGASSDTSVVDVDVRSSISLTDQCGARASWALGALATGVDKLSDRAGSVCRYSFGSNNDSAMLRMYQSDGIPGAMVGIPTSWSWRQIGSATFDLSHAGTSLMLAQHEWDGNGSFRRSTDGGATWTEIVPGDDRTPHISAASGTVAWRAGEGDTKLSTDINAPTPSWTNLTFDAPYVQDLDAVSATVAWVSSGSHVYRTADAGATAWSDTDTGCSEIRMIDAVSASTAFVAGYGRVCQSTDSNGSWQNLDPLLPPGFWATAVMASPGTPTTVWVVGSDGRVARSTDNGASWTEVAALPVPVALLDIDVASATAATVSGDDGLVYRTSDSGATWTRAPMPMTGSVLQVSAPGGTATLVGSGPGGPTASTSDGVAWSSIVSAHDNMRDLDSVNGTVLLGVRSGGAVAYSTNAGVSWLERTTGLAPRNVRGVAMVDENELVVVGDAGAIATSVDAGVTWRTRPSGTTEDLWDVEVDSERRMVAVGAGGTILRTTDNGVSWTTRAAAGGNLRRISFKSGTPMVAVGMNGLIRRSTDNGLTWTTETSGVSTLLDSVKVVSPTVAYAATPGKMVKTTDGGATWVVRGIGGMGHVDAVSEDIVWLSTTTVGGWQEWADYSTDGGATWTAAFTNEDPNVSHIHALDNGQVFFAGQSGAVRVSTAAPTIPDYVPGAWTSGVSLFGACLQDVGGSATAGTWIEDLSGLCDSADSDSWYAVPLAKTKVAQLAASGTGSVDIVWGLRAAAGTAPSTYGAGIVIEAVAPNVP
ncbi:MAG: hypothetical protein JWM90_1604 [Thermoleophilia bacterium]|nr:hypothetical protein [Thermoleophilia bacterium]